MKSLITTIAAVLLVGCGESQQSSTTPETKPIEPVAEAVKPEPPTAKAPDISIHDAAKAGNIEVVKRHLAAGTDVNAKNKLGETPLYDAVGQGHKEIVELVIANGADVNAKDIHGMTPLFHAVRKSQKEMAELLLDEGAHVNLREKRGSTLLHGAAALGHQEIAELLINAGADVNAIDKRRWTPLDWAIWKKAPYLQILSEYMAVRPPEN